MDEAEIEEGRSKEDKIDQEEDDEDEEEDVDFNPFLKGTPSPEASSSLSSEVGGFDGNSSKKKVGDEVRNYSVGDSDHGEEVVMQATAEPPKKKSEPENGDFEEKGKGLIENNVGNVNDDDYEEEEKEEVEVEVEVEEDAICKRTRARYSLVSFTLDELETFLQETDDEDDLLRNVDDEEEYKKFLAAVLLGGDGEGQSGREIEHVDEEDEENDADFEIELEELLESDVDEVARDKARKVEYGRGGRRPETRQNRRQKASAQYEKKLLEQTKRPLRPLLPMCPSGAAAYYPMINGKAMTTEIAPSCQFSPADDGLINGFTMQQIGQLHCLIHEHVQLLVQVFSLCVVDSSRKHIASQIRGLIFEIIQKRNESVACKKVAYPSICFSPPNTCPSVGDELQTTNQIQCTPDSYPTFKTQLSASENISSSEGRQDHVSDRRIVSSQTAGSIWRPSIRCPIMSILEVAPLDLAGEYMEDVYHAVQLYRRRHANYSFDTKYEREPLFNLPYCPSLAETNAEFPQENTTSIPPAATAAPAVVGEQIPKKTLAASIVERAKKQSIALVPKYISKLAHRFLPLFNPALFPHKPPLASVANRVLFTDSEDELLALGIMEYNSDWSSIQRRFLPCKSNHQIFVRQKNRSSSKAPENPIKAVKRIKNSPLSVEEMEFIREGLQVFKLDWMSVWKYAVPHRDPSLLPRQWRIALGTQRSYKVDDAKKEKRRIYELNRRKRKTADLANWQPLSEKEDNLGHGNTGENHSEDDCADNANEASVHQGFLADWRPGASTLILPEHPCFDIGAKGPPMNTLSSNSQLEEQQKDSGAGKAQLPSNGIHLFPYASLYQHPHTTFLPTHVRHLPPNREQLNHQILHGTSNTSKSQIYFLPYWTRRTDRARLVKLAPELPPVNLPPSVRVIPQSDFKNNQSGVSTKRGSSDAVRENIVPEVWDVGNSKASNSVKTNGDRSNQVRENITNSCSAESAFVQDAGFIEESGADLDLQMHPLLFQDSEHERLPYYPVSCSTGSSRSFSFFSGGQPQLNLSLFQGHQQATHVVRSVNMSSKASEFASASNGIDFHPLLQRTDDENGELLTACSIPHNAHTGNQFDAAQSKSFSTAPRPSSPMEKANELDLEIHLSSVSTNGKARESRDDGPNTQRRSTLSNSGIAMITNKICSPHHDCNDNCPRVPSNPVPNANAFAPPSNNLHRFNMDDIGDQSHPEIVMEQEELSDSDEEIEEHVEFECEEMADSDGDASSDCELISEVQDKDGSSCTTEKVSISKDFDQPCEPEVPFHRTTILKKGSPFLKLSLMSPGKDAGSVSWLSLDSCATVGPPSMKAKPEFCTTSEVLTAKHLASCSPNRDSKKTVASPELVANQKDGVDMAQQLSLGPLAVSALRKPRKRACRAQE